MKFLLKVGKEANFEKVLWTIQDKQKHNPHAVLLPRSVPSRFQLIKINWALSVARPDKREIEFIYFWDSPLNTAPFFLSKMEKEAPKWVAELFKQAEKAEGWPKGTLEVLPLP